MAKYKLAMDERETTINWSEVDTDAFITTHNTSLVKKLRKLGAIELRTESEFIPECVSFSIPIKWVRIVKPSTKVMSDEQKKLASERMKLMRESGKI